MGSGCKRAAEAAVAFYASVPDISILIVTTHGALDSADDGTDQTRYLFGLDLIYQDGGSEAPNC